MRSPVAWRALLSLAVGYAALLVAFAGRYGYHRDELYFIVIGAHPAWGYVDEPPLVPLLAHAMDALSGGSLTVLRLPSALAGGAVVLVTGLIARELGGTRAAQALAAAAMAVAAILMAVAHLMSTTTFDVLSWTLLTWLVIRGLRDGGRVWLLVGLVAGIGLQIKTLVGFLLFALVLGVLVAGPRSALRDRWLWAGGALAAVLWAPNVIWQATHGWPQVELSRAIADGSSGSSQPVWAFLPYQLLLVSPVLFPIWFAGLWWLWQQREHRALVVAYATLVVVFLATGGKPYYLAGFFPLLLAAGATPTLRWAARGRARRPVLAAAFGLSLVVAGFLFLPIVPASVLKDTPILAVNYDAGEQVGWPRVVSTVEHVYAGLPTAQRDHAVVLTYNYGEAGALLDAGDHPPTYCGHNSLWDLGPPPADTTTVVAVNFYRSELLRWFTSVRPAGRIDNGVDLDNDEQGAPIYLASGPKESWHAIWADQRRLG